MAIQIQLRRGLAADWTSTNPTLAEGEVGVEKDTLKLKVGNGTTAWTSLAYFGSAGTVSSVAMSVPTGLSVAGSPVTTSGTLAVSLQAGYSIPTTSSQTNWDSAYSERRQWDGGSTNLVAATGRTSLGLVIGTDVLAPNGSAASLTSFPTFNQNTTGTAAGLSATLAVTSGGTGQTSYTDGQLLIGNSTGNTLAKATLTAGSGISITNGSGSISIAATGSGTVTSVTGTSPVVSSGGTTPAISLAASYGDTQNPYASKTANYVLASPDGSAGVPTFRAIVATDIPTLNQNTTGTAANITATSNATLTTLSVLSLPYSQLSGTVPTWNQNTTGTASNVTGTVALANGGSGQTTAQLAMNAFAGAVTSGSYLRGNGTNVVMSTIQAADVPTLNQNTTGTASNVTGTVAIANGGTGATTLAGASIVTYTGTETLSNKTIQSRVVAVADATSITINADTTDMATQANTQALGTLTINAPTGTLANGQKIMLRLQSTNVQTFSWNGVFSGSTDLTLPTTSSGSSKYDYFGFIYNSTATKWQIIAKNFGF
jgi:hypothetical protein